MSTAIDWASNADGTPGQTWNPIVGCAVHSPGCKNCYAMVQAGGPRLRDSAKYKGLTVESKAGPVWTGEVRFWPSALYGPLSVKKPTTYFVNSMGDLFAAGVEDEWLDKIHAVMALCPQHTFIILTKRPDLAEVYYRGIPDMPNEPAARDALIEGEAQAIYAERHNGEDPSMWLAVHLPLPNVWIGVSAERQQEAEERIPILLRIPAAIRLVSVEPMLEGMNLTELDLNGESTMDALNPVTWEELYADWPPNDPKDSEAERLASFLDWHERISLPTGQVHPVLDWVIIGGESGSRARPIHPNWVRVIIAACQKAGVPVWFKQWGAWAPGECAGPIRGPQRGAWLDQAGKWDFEDLTAGAANSLTAENEPDVWLVGKSRSGATLDGVEYKQRPALPVRV